MLLRLAVALLALPTSLAFAAPAAGPVDPRGGGLTVALGEWTLVPEAGAIRPGTVTFVVSNRGRVVHGFRIRAERDRGRSGDRFEARTVLIRPGATARVTVTLQEGVYTIDCFVEGHDDLGMERTFRVAADAPLVTPAPRTAARGAVQIREFRFGPGTLRTRVGTTVRWTNADPAPHTVTSTTGAPLDSPRLDRGGRYSFTFRRAGTYAYVCAVHPSMRGRVVVR